MYYLSHGFAEASSGEESGEEVTTIRSSEAGGEVKRGQSVQSQISE